MFSQTRLVLRETVSSIKTEYTTRANAQFRRSRKEENMANEVQIGRGSRGGGLLGGVYGLAFLGSAIYYIANAVSFWAGVLGFLKALVWPVFLVYKLMEFLKM